MKDLIPALVTPTIRHAMTAAAGWLVANGLLDVAQSGSFTSIATGIVVGAIGLAWSFAKNSKRA